VPQKIESETISVPWTGLDVLLFLAVWFIAQVGCGIFVTVVPLPPPQEQAVTITYKEQEHHGHPIAQLVEQGIHSPMVFLVAFLAAVVAAPLVEELLFRLLLQGWLEAKFSPFRVPWASGVAVVITSFFFAMIHAGNSSTLNGQTLFYLFSAVTVTSLLIFTAGIVYLKTKRNVTMTHCLFGTGRFFYPHFGRYAGYCFSALIFIFLFSYLLHGLCPDTNTDPIPIFFFSLLLGTLYSKTRNLLYCILLHACLNLMSLILLALSGGH
jgi:membrane protease YdiL (CAAX protease family)